MTYPKISVRDPITLMSVDDLRALIDRAEAVASPLEQDALGLIAEAFASAKSRRLVAAALVEEGSVDVEPVELSEIIPGEARSRWDEAAELRALIAQAESEIWVRANAIDRAR